MTEITRTLVWGLGALLVTSPVFAQQPSAPLRTFVIEKPPAEVLGPDDGLSASGAPVNLPPAHDSLRATVGLGYVQGADWGSQWQLGGAFAGIHVASDALVTRGSEGLRFDRGALTFHDPDRGWRLDGGDVFSLVRGAGRGVRMTWRGRWNRRPSLAFYASRPGTIDRPTVAAYRDQIRFGGQTLLDAEVASDRSVAVLTEWTLPFLTASASWREQPRPVHSTDRSVLLEVPLGRGFAIGGGVLRSVEDGETSNWKTVFLRVPAGRWLRLSFERTFTDASGLEQTMYAASAGVTARRLQLFHRHQWGEMHAPTVDGRISIERQQIQSVASYDAGPRVQLQLQMATGWTSNGVPQHWEELLTSLRLNRWSTLQVTAAVPRVTDTDRLRARFLQQLPGAFALEAEFGRLSAYQSLPNAADQSRARVMVSRMFGFATPARGGQVSGVVRDQAGRPVAGARIRLGDYAAVAGADGAFVFANLPRGDYELSIDGAFLPAAYAWDGRAQTLSVAPLSRATADLLVAPLNAVHGRVYVDRNANSRFDAGEGVAAVVVWLGERAIATDEDGNYSFYNVWPGAHAVRLDIARLPTNYRPVGAVDRAVTLGDDGPVTVPDFTLDVIGKPIQWRGIGQAGKGGGQ